MKEILETTQISNNKSSYLIDLIKHDSSVKYVRIEHIHDLKRYSIDINPNVLSDLIEVLNNYKNKINNNLTIIDKSDEEIPKELRDKSSLIQNRYLKGISIKDLAMQFDCKENLIEIILENNGIEIVSNKTSVNWKYKSKK